LVGSIKFRSKASRDKWLGRKFGEFGKILILSLALYKAKTSALA
jgi:hypothetical protein